MKPSSPSPVTPQEPESSSSASLPVALWRDPVLLGAFLFLGILAGFQLAIHLLSFPWLAAVNNWLFVILAWSALPVIVFVSWWLSATHRPGALTWWLLSATFLSYALARTFELAGDEVLIPSHPAYPWWSDLFFLLQAPFIYLALLLAPSAPHRHLRGLARTRVFLDSLLLMGALLLLSWYSLSAPLSPSGEQSLANRFAGLAFAIGALGLLFILVVLFTYTRRSQADRAVLGLWIMAIILVIIGHIWFAVLNQPPHPASSIPPEAFWLLGHMLVPVAALVQFRLTRHTPILLAARPAVPPLLWQDILGCVRFFLPFVIALLASGALIIQAALSPPMDGTSLASWAGSLGLLALVIWRQAVVYLENARSQREREQAQAQEQATREANQQLETFLGIASHELKTPLTTIMMGLQLIQRRVQRLLSRLALEVAPAASLDEGIHALAETLLQQGGRLSRLVNDLLDTSSIQAGEVGLQKQPADLRDIVRAAVEEQQQMAPERAILLHQLHEEAVPVCADAQRIGQVVTNYLTNALKYSGEERPVQVGIQKETELARVWVQDEGPGIPLDEQAQIWRRFHRVPGIEVQSGSGIGLGIGLYLCQTIIARHGGQVGVESTPGGGSRFWFTIVLDLTAGPDRTRT